MKVLLSSLLIFIGVTSSLFAANMKMGYVNDPKVSFDDRQVICTIPFAANSSEITPGASKIITRNISRIRQVNLDEKMLRLEGFASPEGEREKNFRLSIERARAVERFLRAKHGVLLNNYITGFGPTAPEGLTAAGKRAVQIVVYDNPWGDAEIPLEMNGNQE